MATWNSGLKRDGPGLLLRDLLRGKDAQIAAAIALIERVDADVLLLLNFDYDLENQAARALISLMSGKTPRYPFVFSFAPNTGMPSGVDVNADGYFGDAVDAQGHGRFPGQGGMVVLSRWPILAQEAVDYSRLLWSQAPASLMSETEAARMGSVLRLSSVGHWQVPVQTPVGRVNILAWHASTPVFDGPEDRNGRRNADENLFWLHLLSGALPAPPIEMPFVLMGSANLDPEDGEGRQEAIVRLLGDPRLVDPRPRTGPDEQGPQGVSAGHLGDPSLDTADWSEERGPGNLRVQYLLPSVDWQIVDTGIAWPAPEGSRRDGTTLLSRHGMVWADLSR